MAIDSAAKRASALAYTAQPFLRLVVPDGSVDRAASLGLYNGIGAVEDVTAPTVSSRTVGANGTEFTIAFDEAVTATIDTGFTLTPTNGGAAVTLSYTSGSGTSSLVYTASRAITRNETLTLAYTQPGDGIEDAAGNDLASFSGQAVTNNSTQNTTPTDLSLSNSTVLTTAGVNAVVGTLSTTDPDPGDTFTYSLVAGTGDTDNALFNISGASLRCDDPSGLTPGEYFVRIQTSDGVATYAEAFSVFVIEPGTVAIFKRGLIVTDIIQPVVREVIQ